MYTRVHICVVGVYAVLAYKSDSRPCTRLCTPTKDEQTRDSLRRFVSCDRLLGYDDRFGRCLDLGIKRPCPWFRFPQISLEEIYLISRRFFLLFCFLVFDKRIEKQFGTLIELSRVLNFWIITNTPSGYLDMDNDSSSRCRWFKRV